MAAKPSAQSIKNIVGAKLSTGPKPPAVGWGTSGGNEMAKVRLKSPGASFHQTGAATAPTRAAAPAAPVAPAAPAAPVDTGPSPFLTPAQQAALDKYNATYRTKIGNVNPDALKGLTADQITQALINGGGTFGQALSQGEANYTAGLGNAQHVHDISADNANQMMAARGLFQSSIRDGDLNDIDATLATRNAALKTAWTSLQTRIGTQFNTSTTDLGYTDQYYHGLAVQNAQAADTGIPTSTGGAPGSGTGSTSGAATAGATQAASGGPTPTGPPTTQPKSTNFPGGRTPSRGQIGAALYTPSQPKLPQNPFPGSQASAPLAPGQVRI